jgi:predicted transcriptional regulator
MTVATYDARVPAPNSPTEPPYELLELDPAILIVLDCRSRLQIMQVLQMGGTYNTAQLAELLDGNLSRKTVNTHLQRLAKHGWVIAVDRQPRRGAVEITWACNPSRPVPWRMQIRQLNLLAEDDVPMAGRLPSTD